MDLDFRHTTTESAGINLVVEHGQFCKVGKRRAQTTLPGGLVRVLPTLGKKGVGIIPKRTKLAGRAHYNEMAIIQMKIHGDIDDRNGHGSKIPMRIMTIRMPSDI